MARVRLDPAIESSSSTDSDSKLSNGSRVTGNALEHAPAHFRADREVVMVALMSNGCAIQYADEGLRADRTVAMAAIQQNGMALSHLPEYAKDKEMVKLNQWEQIPSRTRPTTIR